MSPSTDRSLRPLRVLSYLATQANPVPAAQIARAIGSPRSSTFRLLRGMQTLGYVTHLPELKTYALGIAALEIGQAFGIHVPLARFGRPVLERLVMAVGESAHLAVLHGHETLYIHEETARSRAPLVTAKDVRLPTHLTASGRMILAGLGHDQLQALFPANYAFVQRTGRGPRSHAEFLNRLDDVRRRGFAREFGEVTEGLASVAMPVRDRSGRIVAAIAITHAYTVQADPTLPGPAQALVQDSILDALQLAARELSHRLGWNP
ncbi:IclR family transcriptional regulator [Cryobacterium sp. MLB-32]|uniref:IclR family transcriptional regulator n=1 Tax=Cryobacterium sp. MLB-32 TaxID=1529318 RepID=UPI0005630120|nr:IclR family transcriptional regulator [Cryobacterium sp. MLB-32]